MYKSKVRAGRWISPIISLEWETRDAKGVSDTEVLLACAGGVGVLPAIIERRENNDLVTTLLNNRGNGSSLLGVTGNGGSDGVTRSGPTSLKNVSSLARADVADDLKLALDEGASLGGSSLEVEEGPGVSTNNVDDGAKSGNCVLLLPDADSLGSGVRASVASPGVLAGGNKVSNLLGRAVTVDDALVTNDRKRNNVPLSPRGDSVDLLSNRGAVGLATGGIDKNTNDHLDTVLFAGLTNQGEGVTVGRVGTDGGDTSSSDGSNASVDLVLAHAATSLVGQVRSESESPGHARNVATKAASGRGGAGAGRSLRGGRNVSGGLVSARLGFDDDRRVDRSNLDGRVGGDLSGRVGGNLSGSIGGNGRDGRSRGDVKGAVDNIVGLNNSGDDSGSGVSAGAVGGDAGDSDGGVGLNVGRRGLDGVGTSGRADVGSGGDNAGGGIAAGLDSGIGAGDGGGGGDNGSYTTNNVGATGDRSRRGNADGRGLAQSHSGRHEGVNTWGGTGVRHRGRDDLVGDL